MSLPHRPGARHRYPRHPLLPNFRSEHWTKTVPPEPHRLMANIDTALKQQVLNIAQRQREPDIKHDHETDRLG